LQRPRHGGHLSGKGAGGGRGAGCPSLPTPRQPGAAPSPQRLAHSVAADGEGFAEIDTGGQKPAHRTGARGDAGVRSPADWTWRRMAAVMPPPRAPQRFPGVGQRGAVVGWGMGRVGGTLSVHHAPGIGARQSHGRARRQLGGDAAEAAATRGGGRAAGQVGQPAMAADPSATRPSGIDLTRQVNPRRRIDRVEPPDRGQPGRIVGLADRAEGDAGQVGKARKERRAARNARCSLPSPICTVSPGRSGTKRHGAMVSIVASDGPGSQSGRGALPSAAASNRSRGCGGRPAHRASPG
jgi:hypothetical protein